MHAGKILGALAAALLMPICASAGDSGFYLGASIGEARQENSVFDGSDTSSRWLGGYSFSKYFAAEAGFEDGGTQKDTIGALDVKSSADGTFVAVLARLPLGKIVAPYARLGYVFYDASSNVSGGGVVAHDTDSDDDLLFGGGIEFRIGEHVHLRADYEKIDVPDIAFDSYSIVFAYQF